MEMNSVSLVPRSRKQILRKLNINKNALVLEIGSGDKPEPRSDVLSDKYTGYTPDRGGREIAIDKRPFIAADAHQLPFKDKSFDYLIVSQVLEYSTNPDKFLKELMRVGKGGYIEVTNEVREILYDWDARNYVVRIDDSGKLLIRKKARRRSPASNWFRDLNDPRLGSFMMDNWSLFNYSLEWNEKINYVIDEKEKDVIELIKDWDVKVVGKANMDILGIITGMLRRRLRYVFKKWLKLDIKLPVINRRGIINDNLLFDKMCCPICKGDIKPIAEKELIICLSCEKSYPYPYIDKYKKRIPVMLREESNTAGNSKEIVP